MWRLRRRAAGRCTGPYAGAAVGAMCGLCRRRASGDAAVVRVVVCTDARPLVRTWTRGGGVCMIFLMLEQSTLLFVGRQSCGAWLFHDFGSAVAGLVEAEPGSPVTLQFIGRRCSLFCVSAATMLVRMRRTGELCALTVAHMILIHVPAPWCMFDAGRGAWFWPWPCCRSSRRCNSLGGRALAHLLMRGLAARMGLHVPNRRCFPYLL